MTTSEMQRAVRSLETIKNMKQYLPTFFQDQQERKASGRLVAWCMASVPTEILLAFDIEPWFTENYATYCAARGMAVHFCEIAEADGYSPEICSYVRNTMGYCRRWLETDGPPPEAPLGGMRKPDMLLGSGYMCDPRYKWYQAIATHYFQCPVHIMDPLSPPYDVDVHDTRIADHYLEQVRSSVKALVSFLEEQGGRKLDRDKLRTIMANSQKSIELYSAVGELRKAVPCPMNSEDYFSAVIPQLFVLGSEEAVDFYQHLYDEVKERVDKGVGVLPPDKEKYRLMWFGLPPWFNLGIFNYLESLGVVFPIESPYYLGKPVEVDLSDPLEALAQRAWKRSVWMHEYGTQACPDNCHTGIYFRPSAPKQLHMWIKEYKLNGAIMHRTRSCRASCVGQVYIKYELERDGFPCLIFESDMADPRTWSDAQVKSMLNAFIEVVAASKK